MTIEEKVFHDNREEIVKYISKYGNTKKIAKKIGCAHDAVYKAKHKTSYSSLSPTEREVFKVAALMKKEESGEFARALEMNSK